MEEREFGIGRALAYGALVGLLVVAVGAGYLYYRMRTELQTAGADDVIVVLALPDDQGVVLPRVIDRVTDGEVESVDPLTTATVPGTSYNVLRETYPFSGAEGLAAALADGQTRPSYVVFEADAWEALAGDTTIVIDVPEQMDVFDGQAMYTFREGEQELDADEIAPLLNGADYVSEESREQIRTQLGEALLEMIAADGIGQADTDLSAEELNTWLQGQR